jgi:hypothetical protein
MFKKSVLLLTYLIISLLLGAGTLIAQKQERSKDELTYVLKTADEDKDAGLKIIAVRFQGSFPDDAAAEDENNWRVIAIDERGGVKSHTPDKATVNSRDSLLVHLRMKPDASLETGGDLDPKTHKIMVRYQQANLPSVTLGPRFKKHEKKTFTAAKGKKDADIYFNGSATGQKGSGPVYSIDAKAGYLQSLKHAGAIGGRATFVSDAHSDIDPDSITATGSYQKIFVLRSPWGIILNSDFLGGEFDKENKTRNLTTELDGTLVLPSHRFGESNFATMDFMGGFEGGHNYKHALNPKGLGNIWRPKFGVNAYFVALAPKFFNRINLSANYLLRLPQTDEPFTEKINGVKISSLTKRPRHYLGVDLGLMFAPSYGVTISYRYGSLPPDFKLVDNKVSVGFTLQLKQANK